MQQVAPVKSHAMRHAASRSSRSLKVGSGPCSRRAVGDGARSRARIQVQRRSLLWIGAVRQVALLAQHHGQLLRESHAADVMQIRGDLGVVCGHGRERLRCQPQARLRRHVPAGAQLLDEQRVVAVVAGHDHRGVVARSGGQQRHAPDVDHGQCLVDGHEAAADLGRERSHVHDHDVDEPDAVLHEALEVRRHVPPGQDAGVDLGVERLDLAADDRWRSGQGADGLDLRRHRMRGHRGCRRWRRPRPPGRAGRARGR